jgi:hypothetical protein
MDRIYVPLTHAFASEYYAALKDAMFILDKLDLKNVSDFLRSKGLDPSLFRDFNSDLIQARVRRFIPECGGSTIVVSK